MDRANFIRLLEDVRAEAAGAPKPDRAPFTVPAARYVDEQRHKREREVVLGAPRIIAPSSLIAAGACVPIDLPGVSALLTRTPDGALRGFANACRHRATRLVDAPCAPKAIVCPYHAWTYDLKGSLIHLPHADAFDGVDLNRRGLAELPVVERHGLVWLGAGAATHASGLEADLEAMNLDRHTLWARARATRRCNWKLIIEAFLEGYHIRSLHRNTVSKFFLTAVGTAEPVGPHIRALTARRGFADAPADLAGVDLRAISTPSYLVFPATVIIEHPDFVSIMTVHPLSTDSMDWDHMMLIPQERAGETEHWAKSWQLIDETVFQREDLWICEQAQRSLNAGIADEMLFGSIEYGPRWFHEALEAALSSS